MLIPSWRRPGSSPTRPVCAQAVASRPPGGRNRDSRSSAARSTARGSATRSAGRRATTPVPTCSAATATSTTPPRPRRRCATAASPRSAILDLDLHYPNGTSALVERMATARPALAARCAGANVPLAPSAARCSANTRRLRSPPPSRRLPRRVAARSRALAPTADAIVLSLGYDTVAGDPHGTLAFRARRVFARIGRLLPPPGCRSASSRRAATRSDRSPPAATPSPTGLLGGGPCMSAREQSSTAAQELEPPTARPSARRRRRPRRFRARLDEIDDALATCSASASRSAAKSPLYKSEHEIAMMQPGRVERSARATSSAAPRPSCRRLHRRPVRPGDRRDVRMEDELIDAATRASAERRAG